MNIYVGNLDFRVDEDDLKEIFEEYGTVSSTKIITDKYTGKSRGFGFVSIEGTNEGRKAIDELNGARLENRVIVVNEARSRKQY